MVMDLIASGFTKADVFDLSVRQAIFLSTVNSRFKQLKTLSDIQSMIAAQNRQMDEMSFSGLTNKLRYG